MTGDRRQAIGDRLDRGEVNCVDTTCVQVTTGYLGVAGFDKDGRRDAASGSVKLSGGEAGPMAVAECSKMDQSLDVW